MELKVLVYDTQQGYFELIKHALKKDCMCIKYNRNTTLADIGMIIFILYDKLEAADYVKLCRKNIPIILGLSSRGNIKGKSHESHGNIHYLNLDLPKNALIKYIKKVIAKISSEKEIKKAG